MDPWVASCRPCQQCAQPPRSRSLKVGPSLRVRIHAVQSWKGARLPCHTRATCGYGRLSCLRSVWQGSSAHAISATRARCSACSSVDWLCAGAGHCLHDDMPDAVHAQLLPWLDALPGSSMRSTASSGADRRCVEAPAAKAPSATPPSPLTPAAAAPRVAVTVVDAPVSDKAPSPQTATVDAEGAPTAVKAAAAVAAPSPDAPPTATAAIPSGAQSSKDAVAHPAAAKAEAVAAGPAPAAPVAAKAAAPAAPTAAAPVVAAKAETAPAASAKPAAPASDAVAKGFGAKSSKGFGASESKKGKGGKL